MRSDAMEGGGTAVVATWLGCLPLTADRVEAGDQHEMLARLLATRDPRILGPVRVQHACARAASEPFWQEMYATGSPYPGLAIVKCIGC
jgi:hypothetical protein